MFFNQRFNFDCGKGKGKVSTQAKRPSQPELILVSIAWSNWGYHCSPLDASPSQGYAAAAPPPPFLLHFIRFLWQFSSTHLYCWLERGTPRLNFFVGGHNTLTWPGLEHRILDPESSAPITGPSFSHECAEEAVLFSTVFLCQLSLGSFNSSNPSLYCLRKVHCQVLLAQKFSWIFATILSLLRARYSTDFPLKGILFN